MMSPHGSSDQSPQAAPHHFATDSTASSMYLEIVRGKTAQRKRPILKDRFLIGSAEWCDLCLGGQQMPLLHSVLHVDGRHVWIDAIASEPELRVNGRTARFTELNPGDDFEIGNFRLKMHGRPDTAFPSPIAEHPETPLDHEHPSDLDERSASELVDLIEQELELVDEFERRRQRGTIALLDAIQRHRQSDQFAETDDSAASEMAQPRFQSSPAELMRDLESAIHSLNRFAQELEQRSERMSPHEVRQSATNLLEFQEDIVSRLDRVLEKVAALQKLDAAPEQRRDVA